MSGIETAVAVVKLFPLLITAANAMYPLLKNMAFWWSYEKTYTAFIESIITEKLFYDQHLQILLQPLDLDLECGTPMHEDPDSELWYDPAVRAKLRRHIGEDNYLWFVRRVEIMSSTLQDLIKLLPTTPQGEISNADSATVQRELERFQLSFDAKRIDLLQTLRSTNEDIRHFVCNESLIRRPISSEQVGAARVLQQHATVLRRAFERELKCLSPSHVHACAVGVHWKKTGLEEDSPSLKLLLGDSGSLRQLVWTVVDGRNSARKVRPNGSSKALSERARKEHVAQWQAKLIEAANNHNPFGVAAAAAMSAALSPASMKPRKLWEQRQTKRLEKGKQRRLPWKPLGSSSRKSSMDCEVTVPKEPSSAVDAQPETATDTADVRVRFAAVPDVDARGSDSVAVSDMCAFLGETYPTFECEHLDIDHSRLVFRLMPSDQSKIKNATFQSLQGLQTSLKMLPDRLRLGVQLARTILSFGTSGWIPSDWTAGHVSVLQGPATGAAAVYLSHKSLHTDCNAADKGIPMFSAKASLNALGITLLELTDGTALCNTTYWQRVCPSGKANEYTSILAAWEWHKKIVERYSDDLSGPIDRCLNGRFSSYMDLQDPGFLKEVFEGVVKPLESFMAGWRTPAPAAGDNGIV